ncbi:MAG TPA: replication-relaxation family protein [Candidatus Saccharimonadales bacterium]|jgi:DNA-binding HxlR family transcriptional regulator
MNSQSAIHYALTKNQRVILDLLYRFRFATSGQLNKALDVSKPTVNKRLRLMMELGYVGRKYEPGYRLLGKHASYYLLSAGTKPLKQLGSERYSPTVLRNTYHDQTASEQFVAHCLRVFDAYCTLQFRYGEDLQFFTKSQLAPFAYFPKRLPDAYIQLGEGDERKLFFLDMLYESRPFFLATRRMLQYIDYADGGNWPAKYALPKVLFVCDTPSLQKRLQKRMRWTIEHIGNKDLRFFTATADGLGDQAAWHDMADPEGALSLRDI